MPDGFHLFILSLLSCNTAQGTLKYRCFLCA
nr:MAG TPA: Hepatitis C virus core protein [Caudoviricetes sp.]